MGPFWNSLDDEQREQYLHCIAQQALPGVNFVSTFSADAGLDLAGVERARTRTQSPRLPGFGETLSLAATLASTCANFSADRVG